MTKLLFSVVVELISTISFGQPMFLNRVVPRTIKYAEMNVYTQAMKAAE